VKIPVKMMLSRLPVAPRTWQRLNLFRAGPMDNPRIAMDTLDRYCRLARRTDLSGQTVLEIGPGNSLLTAFFAASLGARKSWLVDARPLADSNMELFRKSAELLRQEKRPVPALDDAVTVDDVMRLLNATYLTRGTASLAEIPDASVDFIWSSAVLEHVRRKELPELIAHMRRICRPGGIAVHHIDFRDHLQYGLNNMRFPERLWESSLMANSGFYTNRVPYPQMVHQFQEAGFEVEEKILEPWPNGCPTGQAKMAQPFRDLPSEDLLIMDCHIALHPV
jgi:SAM-dependent methyltransferase